MPHITQKKKAIITTAILIVGSFFLFSGHYAQALNDYGKLWDGTLSAGEWNNLPNDFLNKAGTSTMEGPLGINIAAPAAGLQVNGPIVGTSYGGSMSAGNISSGAFGSNLGGGNYSFPGNVGVGTSTPIHALDVVGDINLTGNLLYNGNPFSSSQWLTNSTAIYYNNGNVGVGTSNPNSRLTVAGGDFQIDHNRSIVVNSNLNTTLLLGNYYDGQGFGYGTSTTWTASLAVEGDVKGNRFCIKEDCKAAWTDIVAAGGGGQWTVNGSDMYNANSGNVGIGTTNPGAKLDINGLTQTKQLTVNQSAYNDFTVNFASDSSWLRGGQIFNRAGGTISSPTATFNNYWLGQLRFQGYAPGGYYVPLADIIPMQTSDFTSSPQLADSKITFQYTTPANGGAATIMQSFSSNGGAYFAGNVGVGTTTPGTKLDVIGSFRNTLATTHSLLGGAGNVLVMADNTGTLYSTTTSAIITPIVTSASGWTANGTTVYKSDTNGNVGVGTTNPGQSLSIQEDALGTTVVDTSGIGMTNTTAATAGTQQISPALKWSGKGWATTPLNSQDTSFISYVLPVSGAANPSSNLIFASAINGSAYTSRLTLSSAGALSSITSITMNGALSGASTGAFSGAVTDTQSLTTTPTNGFAATAAAALVGTPVRISPSVIWSGSAWNTTPTAATKANAIEAYLLPVSGAVTSGSLVFANRTVDGGANATEIMRLTTGANVGIGNTNPGTKLDVSGSFRNTLATTHSLLGGAGNAVVMADNTGTLYSTSTASFISNNNLGLWNGTKNGTIYNGDAGAGNVGIGTTAPGAKLAVIGDIAIPKGNNLLWNDTYDSIMTMDNPAWLATQNTMTFNAYAGAWVFRDSEDGNIPMVVMGDGRVGIGTTTPEARLHVSDGLYKDVYIGEPYTISAPDLSVLGAGVMFTRTDSQYADSGIAAYKSASGGNNLVIKGRSDTVFVSGNASDERMRIQELGNVGIGNTAPATKLDVSGSFRNTLATTHSLLGGAGNAVVMTDNTGTLYSTSTASFISSNGLGLWSGTLNGTIWNGAAGAGNVGIGIATTTYAKLAVAGAVQIGDTTDTCDANHAGAIKYNSTSKQSYICDGTKWLNQKNCGIMTDADGHTYGTVQIGGQCWQAENMNVGTMLASGATEPNTADNIIEKWCYNNDANNCTLYGGLYNWNEAMRGSLVGGAQGICASGWHVPTDDEYNKLEKTILGIIASPNAQYVCDLTVSGWQRCADNSGTDVGGTYGAGKSLKLVGVGSGVGAGNDLVGFAGKLSGYRYTDGSFSLLGSYLFLWSSTPSGSSNAWRRFLSSTYSTVLRDANTRAYGYSVRCLRD